METNKKLNGLKVAIVHDWLTGMRGGEMCLEILCDMFPDAPVFTLVHNKGSVSQKIESHPIHTSFLQNFPFVKTAYRNYLPLFPVAIEQMNLKSFDVIISTSHAVAKGIIPHSKALHISYIHTPMRYVWDLYDEYFGDDKIGFLKRLIVPPIASYLRNWDVSSTNRVDEFIANSYNVKQRIWRHYRREAEVIYPPVDTSKFGLGEKSDNFFLIVSAFVPYKRVDLAIEVANKRKENLVIIGNGPDEKKLKSIAGPTVQFKKALAHEELRYYYQNCKALLFPGEEDFGIVPLEAQSAGKPVIAFGKGGILETVINGKTGIYFHEQTIDSMSLVIDEFNKTQFDSKEIRNHALEFDASIYEKKMKQFILQKMELHFK